MPCGIRSRNLLTTMSKLFGEEPQRRPAKSLWRLQPQEVPSRLSVGSKLGVLVSLWITSPKLS